MSTTAANSSTRPRAAEPSYERRHPISRWYVQPAADRLAAALVSTRVRPAHLTVCGLLAAAAAATVLVWRPEWTALAAALVLAAWFFDRADGLLARRQQTASAWGAWLDANVDELVDLGLHVAVAAAAAAGTASHWPSASHWPWVLLIGFLAGKYLFVYGLTTQQHEAERVDKGIKASVTPPAVGWLRRAYHLPGNADVRVHLLVAMLLCGWLWAELAFVAVYYNLRWIVRYVLVARRLGGVR